MFPLIPGSYRFSLLFKNEVSKEFTSLETALVVPNEDSGLQMTSPALGYKSTRPEGNPGGLKPFRFGGCQVYCQPNRVFLPRDTLSLALQVHGLPPEAKDTAEVRYVFAREEGVFRTLSKKISEFPDLPDLIQEFPLADFPPAHYTLQLSLLIGGNEAVSAREEFDITHRDFISRPWVYSKVLPPSSDAVYDYLVGTQYYNIGRMDEAVARLEKAWQMRPESADFAQNLAQAYMRVGEFRKVEPLLRPFFGQDKPAKYEIYLLQGRAYQKAEAWDQAISTFDGAIALYGINAVLLNSVGECYLGKGDQKAALAAWEKSLQLNPDQPEVRRSVESLKGKK
jgi:predicted Zn-dependent protease